MSGKDDKVEKNPKLSDPELITISICSERSGIDSENAGVSFVKKIMIRMIAIFFLIFVVEVVLIGQDVYFSRQRSCCCSFRGHGVDYGKCSYQREGLRDLTEGQADLVIPGDKGYIGESLEEGNGKSGDLPYGTQTLKQQNKLELAQQVTLY